MYVNKFLLVCVCLRVNHYDVTSSGVKVDEGLPCERHHIPRSTGKPLQGSLVVPKHSLSYGHSSRTFTEPVKEILNFEAAVRAGRILRWIESIEIGEQRERHRLFCF